MAKTPSSVVSEKRIQAHDFMMTLESLVAALESAELIFDEAAEKSDNRLFQITWARIKGKMAQIQGAK